MIFVIGLFIVGWFAQILYIFDGNMIGSLKFVWYELHDLSMIYSLLRSIFFILLAATSWGLAFGIGFYFCTFDGAMGMSIVEKKDKQRYYKMMWGHVWNVALLMLAHVIVNR